MGGHTGYQKEPQGKKCSQVSGGLELEIGNGPKSKLFLSLSLSEAKCHFLSSLRSGLHTFLSQRLGSIFFNVHGGKQLPQVTCPFSLMENIIGQNVYFPLINFLERRSITLAWARVLLLWDQRSYIGEAGIFTQTCLQGPGINLLLKHIQTPAKQDSLLPFVILWSLSDDNVVNYTAHT